MNESSTWNWVPPYLFIPLGSGVFALSGRDPRVRTSVLSGLNTISTALSTTFINAFLQKLQSGRGTIAGTDA